MINNVTIGSDAEVIVQDLTGRPFPVCGMLGGTKLKPRRLGQTNYFIQEDNVLLEFNIPVCNDLKEFKIHMHNAYIRALGELPPTLRSYPKATARFEEALLEFPQAKTFGCEPDYNAWTVEENPRPTCDDPLLRSAAGHIHIGWDKPNNDDRLALIKAADIFVGLRSIGCYSDRERRKLYGKAGSFRPKDYGIEHRVLCNEWVMQGHYATIYSWYMDAINFVNGGNTISDEDADNIQLAINSYDDVLASKLLSIYQEKIGYSMGCKNYENLYNSKVLNDSLWSRYMPDSFASNEPPQFANNVGGLAT